MNSAECTDQIDAFDCTCEEGFTGNLCESMKNSSTIFDSYLKWKQTFLMLLILMWNIKIEKWHINYVYIDALF